MEFIAARIRRQWVEQYPALQRILLVHDLQNALIIDPRLVRRPRSIRPEFLEMQQRAVAFQRMAVVAARPAGSDFQEDWLDIRDKVLEIERVGARAGNRGRG